MAPLRPGQPYSATWQLTNVERQTRKYKEIEKIIRQQGRPHMEIPARTKKNFILRIWIAQDRMIAEKEGHQMPEEEELEGDSESKDGDDKNELEGELSEEIQAAYKVLEDENVHTPTTQQMRDDMDSWGVTYKGCRNKYELKQRWAPAWVGNKNNKKKRKASKEDADAGKKRKWDNDDEDSEDEEPSKFQKTSDPEISRKKLSATPTASKRKRSTDDDAGDDESNNSARKRRKNFATPEQIAAADKLVKRVRGNLAVFYKEFEARQGPGEKSFHKRVVAAGRKRVAIPKGYDDLEDEEKGDAAYQFLYHVADEKKDKSGGRKIGLVGGRIVRMKKVGKQVHGKVGKMVEAVSAEVVTTEGAIAEVATAEVNGPEMAGTEAVHA